MQGDEQPRRSSSWNKTNWTVPGHFLSKCSTCNACILGPDHPDTLPPKVNLVQAASTRRQTGRGSGTLQIPVGGIRRILGPDHPDTARMMKNLANMLYDQGKLDEALKIEEQLVETRWRVSGPCHMDTFLAMGDLIQIRMSARGHTGDSRVTCRTRLKRASQSD